MVKNGIGQGIQGAKNFAGRAWNFTKQGISKVGHFVYENRELIGGALQAIAPLLATSRPELALAMKTGGYFLSNLNPGPVKDKLKEVSQSYNNENVGVRGSKQQSLAQQALEQKKAQRSYEERKALQLLEERKKKRKKGKVMSQL